MEKGKWRRSGREIIVAMKTLKEGKEEDKIMFLQEAVIMAQFKHPNVLLLHGVASQDNSVRKFRLLLLLYGVYDKLFFGLVYIIWLIIILNGEGCL